MVDPYDPVQWATFFVIVAVIVFEWINIVHDSRNALWIIPVLAWMIHSLIFYVIFLSDYALTHNFPVGLYYRWEAALRLQGYLTVLALEVVRWYIQYKTKRGATWTGPRF